MIPEGDTRWSIHFVAKGKAVKADRVIVFVNAPDFKTAKKRARMILKSPTRWVYL